MSKNILFFVILSVIVGLVVSYPQRKGGEICYGQVTCPKGTIGCKFEMNISEDRNTLVETIICLDAEDKELKRFTKEKPNPYAPDAEFNTTSYSRSYSTYNRNMGQSYFWSYN